MNTYSQGYILCNEPGQTREEWWDILVSIRTDADREEFDRDWDEFQRMKAAKELH